VRSGPSSTFQEDGKETIAPKRVQIATLTMARQRAEQMGVTVNGLIAADDDGDLASYYTDEVIVGSNAFVMGVSSYSEYAAAIRGETDTRNLAASLSPGNARSYWFANSSGDRLSC
jgi:Protein of unknown function (DUF1194)